MTLRGYTAPLSPDGRAGIVPPPPWHYSGDFLIAEYRTDPDAVAALLPPELEPAEDPGAVAAIFADWQSCSLDLHELEDPIQSQYREFFLVVGARFQRPAGEPLRVHLGRQGLRDVPRLDSGLPQEARLDPHDAAVRGREGDAAARGGRALRRDLHGERSADRAHGRSRSSTSRETGPTVNDPPMHNTRHFPAASGDRPDVFELVRAGGYDRDATEIWEGSAELRLYDDTLEDLQAIAPREMLRGYRFSFGYTVDGVEVVAQHQQEALIT